MEAHGLRTHLPIKCVLIFPSCRHGSTRLFQAVLNTKQLEANLSNGTPVENPLVGMGQAPAEVESTSFQALL